VHVLFLTDNFPPEVNAPASRTFEHAREWVRLGHRVTVVTCAPNFPFGTAYPGYRNLPMQREQMAGIEVVRVWSFMSKNEGFWLRSLDFASFMASSFVGSLPLERPDVVVATSPQFFTGLAGWAVARQKRAPFVLEIRDLWPDQIVANGMMGENGAIRFFKRIAQFLYDEAAAVVTVGDGYAERIRGSYRVERPIDVVPNGIIAADFKRHGVRDARRKALKWEGKFVSLYLGTHGASQKLETIVDAAAALKSDRRFHFAFVGDGAARAGAQAYARSLALENVEFLGQCTKDDVPGFYEAADACLVPLRDSELYRGNFPSKMFEAMALECPIVLSVGGVAEELLLRAGAGLSVPPEDARAIAAAVRQLDERPEEREAMGAAGRAFVVEHYSREAWARRLLEVFERVRGGSTEAA
jgi:hypothetical protein